MCTKSILNYIRMHESSYVRIVFPRTRRSQMERFYSTFSPLSLLLCHSCTYAEYNLPPFKFASRFTQVGELRFPRVTPLSNIKIRKRYIFSAKYNCVASVTRAWFPNENLAGELQVGCLNTGLKKEAPPSSLNFRKMNLTGNKKMVSRVSYFSRV